VSVSAAHLSCSVAIHLQASSPRPAALNPPPAAIFEFVGCRAGVSARFLLSLQQEQQQQQQKQTEVPVTRPQENKLQPASFHGHASPISKISAQIYLMCFIVLLNFA